MSGDSRAAMQPTATESPHRVERCCGREQAAPPNHARTRPGARPRRPALRPARRDSAHSTLYYKWLTSGSAVRLADRDPAAGTRHYQRVHSPRLTRVRLRARERNACARRLPRTFCHRSIGNLRPQRGAVEAKSGAPVTRRNDEKKRFKIKLYPLMLVGLFVALVLSLF